MRSPNTRQRGRPAQMGLRHSCPPCLLTRKAVLAIIIRKSPPGARAACVPAVLVLRSEEASLLRRVAPGGWPNTATSEREKKRGRQREPRLRRDRARGILGRSATGRASSRLRNDGCHGLLASRVFRSALVASNQWHPSKAPGHRAARRRRQPSRVRHPGPPGRRLRKQEPQAHPE
jgi:hypothetical protein